MSPDPHNTESINRTTPKASTMTIVTFQGSRPLPTQPLIAAAVLHELTVNSGSELTPLVEIDPSLTAVVLQAANAPHLRQSRRVASVRQAMVILGSTAVEAIATSRTAALVLGPDDIGCPSGFWVRSVAAAAASSAVAQRLGTNMEEAFAAGILHDLGDLMLYRRDHELHGICAGRLSAGGRTILEQEKVLFGRTHTDTGADRMEQWLLPDRIVRAVRWHHAAPEALSESLARVVWAGVRLGAVLSGSPFGGGSAEITRPDAVLKAIGLGSEDPKAVLADAERQVQQVVAVAGRER